MSDLHVFVKVHLGIERLATVVTPPFCIPLLDLVSFVIMKYVPLRRKWTTPQNNILPQILQKKKAYCIC